MVFVPVCVSLCVCARVLDRQRIGRGGANCEVIICFRKAPADRLIYKLCWSLDWKWYSLGKWAVPVHAVGADGLWGADNLSVETRKLRSSYDLRQERTDGSHGMMPCHTPLSCFLSLFGGMVALARILKQNMYTASWWA